jgi:malectin (di-glucose binding ER protein)
MLYQSERYGIPSFAYRFTVPNGTHRVTLKFAEIFFTQAGQRVFNVAINGQSVLTNFDIVAQAGAAFTAVDRQVNVNVTDGQIRIDFSGVVSNAKVSANRNRAGRAVA